MSREKRRIRRHIDNLNSPDKDVSARAEGYLLRYYGARALDELIEACSHENPVVRYRAVWVLGYTHDARAFETILKLTDDTHEGVRYDATVALGILGDTRATEPLMRMWLANDETRPAGMAFGRMGVQAIPAVESILESGSPEVRWSATQVLGNFAQDHGDKQSIGILYKCLADPDPSVRENARFWIDEIGLWPKIDELQDTNKVQKN
jgi:HEAT repeat protein